MAEETIRSYDPLQGDAALDESTPDPTAFGRLLQLLTQFKFAHPGISAGAMPFGPGNVMAGQMGQQRTDTVNRILKLLDDKVPGWRRLAKEPTRIMMKRLPDAEVSHIIPGEKGDPAEV